MLKTFIEECGFVASGHEWSRGIPDLIALAPFRHGQGDNLKYLRVPPDDIAGSQTVADDKIERRPDLLEIQRLGSQPGQ
jgi:hypothetical protein